MANHGPRAVVLRLLLQTIHLTVMLSSLFPLPSECVFTSNHTAAMPAPCLPDQASALLQLKRSFTTTNYSISAFRSWRIGTDCCYWVGVQCGDSDGRVTSLDLGGRGLESGGLDPVLFHLDSLKYLNLAYNDFNGSQLPSSGFERLARLTNLNLSSSSFSGPVPTGIGNLTNLVSLDLSTSYEIVELLWDGFLPTFHSSSESARLIEQNFENLIHKLSNLEELHLGFVNMSNSGIQWCHAIAVSCPKLQVLSLPFCRLSGPICNSFSSLHSVSVINLEHNLLSGPFPDFFSNLPNLTVLQLRHNYLQGWIPPAIFQHKKLETIDLYANYEISGYLPNFSIGTGKLENLDVGRTNFSGTIPASVSNLISLKKLGLGARGFSGELPSSIGNLTFLSALDISGVGLVGSMPLWVANLTSLASLRFHDCGLSGSVPSFLGDLRYLKELLLCNCDFSGHIPSRISNLTRLQVLLLYANNFMGTMELTFTTNLPNLMFLDLSDNNLIVRDGEDNSSLISFPKLSLLGLQSCSLSKFPNFLRHQDEITWIDLSDNEIHGTIPQWAWETWNSLYILRLENNNFTSTGYPSSLLPLKVDIFDLSNNMFEGPIPIPQGYAHVLDYSNNMFSSVPSDFSSHLSNVTLFLASGNNLSGKIPLSLCSGTGILLLDLSYNKFSGSIPSCLMENVNGMQSLYLRENKLTGKLPDTIKDGCPFEALDLSGNWIEGQLPRSLLACKYLEVLDVGNNQISDSFPCWMSTLPGLEVLVLKSNRLYGQVAQSLGDENSNCAFPSAIILDLSSNNLSGPFPWGQWFLGFKSMIFTDANKSLVMEQRPPNSGKAYAYAYSTAVTYKGRDTTFSKILRTLVVIDLSNNAFNGSIPKAIGELRLLHGLNISHNFLSGPIPSQLGQLRQLEALDLSSNELSGEIPQELASLNFLTTLNLSNNKLVGSIPESPQFMTFSNGSFVGNEGLCGPPLSKECMNKTIPNVVSHHPEKKSANIITFLFAGMGFGVGFAITMVVAWGIPIRKRSEERQ